MNTLFTCALLFITLQLMNTLATYVDDVGVHEAGDPLVLADHPGVLIVGAVAAAPAARLAGVDALLAAVAQHVVQPDLP